MTCGLIRGGSRRKTHHMKNRKLHRKGARKSRKANRSHRNRRHQGGVAPVSYALAGDWASKMSLGQGGDYFKYHAGQHGGSHLMGAPIAAITGSSLPEPLRASAHLGGIDAAINDVRGLKDQAGGRRKQKKRSQKKQRSQKKKQRRSRGGSLAYAPFPSDAMLLKSPMQYAQAGLHPEWKTAVEYDLADARASQ